MNIERIKILRLEGDDDDENEPHPCEFEMKEVECTISKHHFSVGLMTRLGSIGERGVFWADAEPGDTSDALRTAVKNEAGVYKYGCTVALHTPLRLPSLRASFPEQNSQTAAVDCASRCSVSSQGSP